MICNKCGNDEHFYLGQAWCKKCIKAHQQTLAFKQQKREYYQRNKARIAEQNERKYLEWFTRWKDGLSCAMCDESFPDCLDFHHRDPSQKLYAVSQMVGMPARRIRAEIAKCVVLCANCHKKVHALLREGLYFL
jgi:hypothetical protein